MANPQPGIFALGGRVHHHLEFDAAADLTALGPAIRDLRDAADGISGVNLVVGLGADAAASLGIDVPSDLTSFSDIEGADGYRMPGTQHDLWLWLHGGASDAIFDLARLAVQTLAGIVELASEQPAFVYRNSQDLTGFEDGTENPSVDEALEIATVPADQPGAGGNVVLLQRWVHDLAAFDTLDIPQREQVIGRTLDGSVELGEDIQPPDSHVSRVVVEDDDGEELEVWRRSTPFGTMAEHGLMFLAFSRDRDRLQQMLERMAGVGDGVRDQLTNYSTPTHGAWYFAPPVDALR